MRIVNKIRYFRDTLVEEVAIKSGILLSDYGQTLGSVPAFHTFVGQTGQAWHPLGSDLTFSGFSNHESPFDALRLLRAGESRITEVNKPWGQFQPSHEATADKLSFHTFLPLLLL